MANEQVWTGTAAAQLGALTRRQLEECGVSRRRIERLLRTRILRRRFPGVYVVSAAPSTWRQAVIVAVLACGEGAVASYHCAAFLHELAGSKECRAKVTIPRKGRPLARGVEVHRSLVLAPADVSKIGPIPVTTVARTLVDLSGVRSLGQLARALDDALVRRRVRLDEVRACAARCGPAPGRHPSKLAVLLAERGDETRLAESRPEMRVMRVIVGAGLPAPVQQHVVRVNGERFRLDFAYPDEMVGLEYQGFDPHRSRSAFDRDYRRDRLLRSAGWDLRYFTSATADAEIVQTVRALVG